MFASTSPISRVLRIFFLVAAFFYLVFLGLTSVTYAAPPSVIVDKKVSNANPSPGEAIEFTIRYRCASLTDNCYSTTITDVVPTNFEIDGYTGTGGWISGVSASGQTIVWELGSGTPRQLDAGTIGSITLYAHVPACNDGSILASTTATNTAEMVAYDDLGSTAVSTDDSVTINVPEIPACVTDNSSSGNPSIDKTVRGPGNEVAIGGEREYRITLPQYTSGGDTAYVVTDTIPANALVMEITNDGGDLPFSIECGNTGVYHAITGELDRTSHFSSKLGPIDECLYEPHPTISGHFVTNITSIRWDRSATITGNLRSDVAVSFPTTNPFDGQTLPPANTDPALPNWTAPLIGERVSNCIDASVWNETDCQLVTIVGDGVWPSASKLELASPSFTYRAPGNNSDSVVGLDSTANPPRIQGPSDLIYRIDVEAFTYGTGSWSNPVVVDLLDPNLEYVPYPVGDNWWAVELNDSLTDSDCELPSFTVTENYSSTGRTLLRWEFNDCTIPTDTIDDHNERDWIVIEFSARIKEGTLAGTEIDNRAIVYIDGDTQIGSTNQCNTSAAALSDWPDDTDVNDIDEDGLTNEIVCRSDATNYEVNTISDMTSSKWVQGALDSGYSRFPFNGLTDLSSAGSYQLFIENTGNVTMTVVDVVDILPFIGDTGVLPSTGSRDSAWTAVLGQAITVEKWNGSSYVDASADLALGGPQYSTSNDPCRFINASTNDEDLTADESEANGPSGCDTPNWTTTAVGASSFSIRYDPATGGLLPGEHLRITASIVIDGNPPGCDDPNCDGDTLTADAVAWNSFAFGGTFDNGGSPSRLLDSEPIKVGLEMFDTNQTAGLGDFVWYDTNGNGIQDAGEAPVEGVTVSLYQAGVKIADVTTDANGFYAFYGLDPSTNFTITLENAADFTSGALQGYSLTAQNQGSDDAEDSDAALDSDGFPVISAMTGAAGTNDYSYDFGFWQPASIGNRVWYDVDGAGDQGIGDAGAENVTVTLLQPGPDGLAGTSDDVTVGTQQTDADGYYLFTDLPEGQYFLEFDYSAITGNEPISNTTVNRDEWEITIAGASGDANTDSDVSVGGTYTGTTGITYLSAGETDLSWDMGLEPVIIPANPVSLGNYVWEDTNENDVQDGGEPGIAGVRVELYDDSGLPIGVTFTDSDGFYQFDNLENNTTYSLRFVAPDGFTLVDQNSGSDDRVDSDVDATTGFVTFVLSTTAATNISDPDSSSTIDARWDAGMVGTLSIGNLVWFDLDGDGAVDDGEPVLDGVNVRLLDADNSNAEVATTTTDSNGRYLFDGLAPGNYIVEVEIPDGTTTTSDTTNSTNPDNGDDNDDNGTDDSTADVIRSSDIALGYRTVDNGESDHGVEINGVTDTTLNRNADYTLDFGFVKRDFGDLDDQGNGNGTTGDYNTDDSDAASHTVWDTDNDNVPDVSGAIWLGSLVDGETDGQPATNPNGSNGDGADEDGVTFRSGSWPVSTVITEALSITLNGIGSANADIGVWIDWDDDGTFDDFYELSDVSAGTHTVDVNAPATYGGNAANRVHFRVRAFESGTALAVGSGFNGASSNGEVEDYRLQFSPTAVTLAQMSANTPGYSLPLAWLLITAVCLMAVTMTALWFNARRVGEMA